MFGASSRHDKVFYRGFEQQAERLVAASQLLEESLESKKEVGLLRATAAELRRSGDEIARNLILELRKTWITPFDPQDVRSLITELDRVSEAVHGAVERLSLFDPVEGNGERGEARRLAGLLVRSTQGIEKALKLMAQKRREQEVLQLCSELRQIEGQADDLYRQALHRLYQSGGNSERRAGGPESAMIEILKWHDLFDKLEEAAARCRRVSDEIETIVEGHA